MTMAPVDQAVAVRAAFDAIEEHTSSCWPMRRRPKGRGS